MDVVDATLFGQHALAYAVLAYGAEYFRRRVLRFPLWQQAVQVAFLLAACALLVLAVARLKAAGWAPAQADITVIAETPKIGPHRPAIRERLAAALGVPPDAVMVKGKTNEGMGWIGHGEGLACIAVATLHRAWQG